MSKNFELLSRYYEPNGARQKYLPLRGTNLIPSDYTAFRTDPSVPGGESDLRRTVRILGKRWRAVVLFAAAIFSLAAFATMIMGIWWPRYAPQASIEVDPPGQEAFSMDRSVSAASDPDLVETQVERLQDDDLAIAVIRELHLDQNKELTAPHWYAPLLRIFKHHAAAGNIRPGEIVLTSAESAALNSFQQRLSVDRTGNSRLITVSFWSENPHVAAEVTNVLVRDFIEQYYKSRYDAVMQSSEWLSRQLEDIRQKMEQSSGALARYQKATGITDIDDKQSTFTQRVADVNHQLTQAETDEIQAEAYLNRVQLGQEDSLPQVRDNLLIQALKQRLADARAALSQAAAVYGANHPQVQELQSRVKELETATGKEEKSIVESLRTSYAAATARKKMITGQMNDMINEMNKMSQYSELKKTAQTNTDLYNALYQRVKEAGISAASKSSNITVGGQARVLDQPTSPHVALNLAIGLFLGLLGGVVLVFVREGLDDSIRTPEELKYQIGTTPLAIVPLAPGNGNAPPFWRRLRAGMVELPGQKFLLDRPLSPEAEAVRALAASILLSCNSRPAVVMITSLSPGDGKTTLAINVAIALSEQGKTCLVDADVRKPMIAKAFAIDEKHGLADVISGAATLQNAVHALPSVPGLSVLPIGTAPENPGAFVVSSKIQELVQELRQRFDFIVVDSPPLGFADARFLSRLVDGLVLVGRWGRTTRQAMLRSLDVLDEVGAPLLGIVLNGVDASSLEYDYFNYTSAAKAR